MLTYQLFLGHNVQHRLEFYQQYIDLPHEYQNVEGIAKLRNVSATSVYRTIQLITDDLNQIRREQGIAPIGADEPIMTRFDIPSPAYAVYLMRQSLVGRFIIAILHHPDWSLADFARNQHTSNATVSRRIKPLQNFLRQYGVRFTFQRLGICGNELIIRVALSEICWQLSQDGTNLFPELGAIPHQAATKLAAAQITMPNYSPIRLELICAINLLRANAGHPLRTTHNFDVIVTATGFKHLLGELPEFNQDFPNSVEIIHLETLLTAGFHSVNDPLLSHLIGYHARTNTAEWQLINLILHRIKTIAGINAHALDNQVLVGNLLSITVALNLFGVPVPVFDPIIIAARKPAPTNSLQKTIDLVFATLPDHLQTFKKIQSTLVRRIIPLLTTAMPDATKKVQVHIDETMDHQIYVAVVAALTRMPTVHLVQEAETARLIVTSDLTKAFAAHFPETNFFYFPISSYKAWLRLEHYVHYLAMHDAGLQSAQSVNGTYLNDDILASAPPEKF